MKNLALSLVLFCNSIMIFAQNNHEVNWNSNFILESSSLDKSFLDKMLYGGYISNNLKTKWIGSVNKKNTIYFEFSNGFNYKYSFKKQYLKFSFVDRNIINTNFTDDLLRLGLEGNFNYQDQTLDFDNTNIRGERFQQYKLLYGFKNKKIMIEGGLSYINGNHHISYIIEKGKFYTSPYGTYIDLEYNMSAFITDTSDFSLLKNNGKGLSVDFSTSINIKNHDIQLSILDLGFIMWNPSSISLAVDSTFSLKGIEVNNIFNFNDSLVELSNLEDDINNSNNSSFKTYIPSTINISISSNKKNRIINNYSLGIISKWQPYKDDSPISIKKISQGIRESNFSTLYYINTNFITKYCDIITSLSWGGYAKDENIGLAISKGEKYNFILGTNHLEDLIIQSFFIDGNKAKSFNIYFNMKIQF